jgi:6-pyruvoyltetrahydropterin/6-carboxytetrahydropterin synthase
MIVTCKDSFAASHVLSGYNGKCKNLHGHTYHVEVTAYASKRDSMGMVVDFNTLKRLVHDTIEEYDHAFLYGKISDESLKPNTDEEVYKLCRTLGLKVKTIESGSSSTENIAEQLCMELNDRASGFIVFKVRLSESDKTYAEVVYDGYI